MSILVGMGLVNFLGLFTILIDYLSKFTKQYPLLLVVILIVGDSLFGFSYYVIGKEFVSDMNNFKLGLGLSFMFATFGRVIYFLVNAYKRGII
tara:strand:- start:275 stop:553 length:279 start_codon:yes stop_codon:yes gene_type:complete